MNFYQTEKIASGDLSNVFNTIDYDKEYLGYCCYCICDTIDGFAYIGKTCNAKSRISMHMTDLKAGRHRAKDLQKSFLSGNRVVGFIIEKFESELLAYASETYWINRFGDMAGNFYRPSFFARLHQRDHVFLTTIKRFNFYMSDEWVSSCPNPLKEFKMAKIVRLLKSGLSINDISKEMQISESNVKQRVRSYKIKFPDFEYQ